MVANSKKDKDRVESMNNVHGSNIKRQRDALIKQRGSVEQQQFLDEKLRIQSEATNMYKGTVKGGR